MGSEGKRGGGRDRVGTKLHDDFPKVIRMPRPAEEPHVTDSAFLRPLAETVLLHIAHAFHNEADDPQNHAGDVPPRPKTRLMEVRHVRRVKHRDRQTARPDPEHLKDPEPEKLEEVIPLVVEAVVFARLDDPEEQEAGEARAPEHHEDADEDLARVVRAGEGEGEDGEEDEVGPAGEVGELVEVEGPCYGEEGELVGDGDEEGYGEVVVVEDVDGCHGGRGKGGRFVGEARGLGGTGLLPI